MKRILLLLPKSNGPGNHKKWNSALTDELENSIDKSLWKIATPGLLLIASLTDKSKYQTDVIEEEDFEIDFSVKYDIVAMYTITPNAKRAYYLAAKFKETGSYIVLGGVHVSVCREEATVYADTLLLGECEVIWPEFLKNFENGKQRKIYESKLGSVDLKQSPTPDFNYIGNAKKKIIPIQTARGCPHGCKFCNLRSLYGKDYRAKEITQVAREIEAALEVNPKATIYFTDDNFFCAKERAGRLLDCIKEYGVYWYVNSEISISDEIDLLDKAYDSGCRQILIGLESIRPETLIGQDENDFKSRYAKRYLDCIKHIQQQGIGVVGSFIMGMDGDNYESFEKTARFIWDATLYGANITMATPYPGTLLYKKLVSENRLLINDWDKYTIFQPIYSPVNLSIDDLNQGYVKLLETIHSDAYTNRKLVYFKEIYKRKEAEKKLI